MFCNIKLDAFWQTGYFFHDHVPGILLLFLAIMAQVYNCQQQHPELEIMNARCNYQISNVKLIAFLNWKSNPTSLYSYEKI